MSRQNQKSAISAGDGSFNGKILILATILDAKKLNFTANIQFNQSDNTPITFTPVSDDGYFKKFADLDDAAKWVNGAFVGITNLDVTVTNPEFIAKVVMAPTDPVAFGLKQKAFYTKLKADIADNKTRATTAVTVAAGYGWDVSSDAALVANYTELVARKDAILAIEAYYTDRISFYTV